jgi:hypothetical protein
VRFNTGSAVTQSLVMHSPLGTVRMIKARHQLAKLNQLSSINHASRSRQIQKDKYLQSE